MFDNITSAIEAIAAIGNIVLLIYFTSRDWKHLNQRERQEKNEKKLEREKKWYDRIVINKVLDYITEYFDKTDKEFLGVKPQKDEEKKKRVEIIKNYTSRYRHLIIPYLKIFSDDLAKKVSRIIIEYNDLLINEMASEGRNYSLKLDRKMDELKEKTVLEIYAFKFDADIDT